MHTYKYVYIVLGRTNPYTCECTSGCRREATRDANAPFRDWVMCRAPQSRAEARPTPLALHLNAEMGGFPTCASPHIASSFGKSLSFRIRMTRARGVRRTHQRPSSAKRTTGKSLEKAKPAGEASEGSGHRRSPIHLRRRNGTRWQPMASRMQHGRDESQHGLYSLLPCGCGSRKDKLLERSAESLQCGRLVAAAPSCEDRPDLRPPDSHQWPRTSVEPQPLFDPGSNQASPTCGHRLV